MLDRFPKCCRQWFLCATMLCGVASAHGQKMQNNPPPTSVDNRLAAVKTLKIDAGTITFVERSDSPTLTLSEGQHLMTVAAKQLIKAYYGKAPAYSYFNRGSTGGQQGLQEAQRYPEDYDGIQASIPAHCRTPLHAYFLWNDQILNKCPFTKSQQENVVAAGNEYMAPREVPAIAGKFVADPRCD